jgi:nucleotide-binding universal stress UspA family protein
MIKDILAFANEGLLTDSSFALPIALAKKFGARLSAVYVMPEPYVYVPVEPGAASVGLIEAAIDAAQKAADENGKRFKALQQRSSIDGAWYTANFWDEAVSLAYRQDLLVARQSDSALPDLIAGRGVEHIATTMGRPTLVVPAKGQFPTCGQRVLVAWKPTKEAARAVHDCLPLLDKNAEVTVLEVDPPAKAMTVEAVAQHLGRHGFKSKSQTAQSDGTTVTKVILERAAAVNADLIVMGAYTHSRLRELILGGVTKSMLQEMTVPVLMSH